MISAIIPIYNAGDKLHRILSSIEKQTYGEFEVLLIDDGSLDDTEKICKAAAKLDERIHYFYQKNRGVSEARNHGLQKAEGEYITFLDADDEIEENYFEELLKACADADIAVCDVVCETEQRAELLRFSLEKQVLTQTKALSYLLTRKGINSGPGAKLFRRKVVESLRFPELKAYEDILFNANAFLNAEKIAVVNSTAYHYIQNQNSTMDVFLKTPSTDVIAASEYLIRIFLENENLEKECLYITLSHLYQYVIPLLSVSENHMGFIGKVRQIFRKYYRYIIINRAFPWKEKIVYGLFCLGWSYRDKTIVRIRE